MVRASTRSADTSEGTSTARADGRAGAGLGRRRRQTEAIIDDSDDAHSAPGTIAEGMMSPVAVSKEPARSSSALALSPNPRSGLVSSGTLGSTITPYYTTDLSVGNSSEGGGDAYLSAEQCVALYLENCKKYGVHPDPGVIVSLQTRWYVLQPTRRLGEGALLPLLGVLERNAHIRSLRLNSAGMGDARFSAAGNGNTNARVLNAILKRNNVIEELDLSEMGLDDDGLGEICEALRYNKSVTKINISRNYFSPLGAERLRRALEENVTIESIDLSRNALGFQSIQALQQQCCVVGDPTTRGLRRRRERPVHMNTMGNYAFEEILNAITHGVGFLFSIIGTILLMSEVTDTYGGDGGGGNHYTTDYHFYACALFSGSLLFLFLASSLFHSFFMLPQASYILQIFDHIGIYMLIAGSYTPILMIGLHQHASATALLSAVWIVAVAGAVFSAFSDLNNPVTNKVELVLFLLLGSSFLLIWPVLFSLPAGALALLIIGGFAYIFGILFFILGETWPIYHVVWHCFVMIGASMHWFDVYFFIVALRLGDEVISGEDAESTLQNVTA